MASRKVATEPLLRRTVNVVVRSCPYCLVPCEPKSYRCQIKKFDPCGVLVQRKAKLGESPCFWMLGVLMGSRTSKKETGCQKLWNRDGWMCPQRLSPMGQNNKENFNHSWHQVSRKCREEYENGPLVVIPYSHEENVTQDLHERIKRRQIAKLWENFHLLFKCSKVNKEWLSSSDWSFW